MSDILLQGHLYITNNYFAFYSNVFGFVTKLLIPIVSVVKISKEKTAKIIPNAIGVATAEERHVFGSFIRREAAYRLMLSIWLPVVEPTTDVAEVVLANSKLLGPGDVEASEFSIEDDSSSAISGNESPPIGIQESTTSTDASQTVRHRIRVNGIGIDVVDNAVTSSGLPDEATTATTTSSGYPTSDFPPSLSSPGDSLPSRSTSPPPKMVHLHRIYQFEFPDNFVRLGCILCFLLVLLSIFLTYRIMNVSSNSSMSPLNDFGALNARLVSFRKSALNKQKQTNLNIYNSLIERRRTHRRICRGVEMAETTSVTGSGRGANHT